MFGTRGKAVVLVAAAVAGYAGAAAFSALALPSVAIASDYGPGDGLTRYVVTASTEAANGLGGLPGVVNTQRLSDGRTLVATDGLTPAELQRVPGVSAVEASPSVPVMAAVTDPYWPNYGWNLDNTGANAYSQTAVADADTDAPDAWPVSTGSPVVVAVVDTGYYTAHPDLQGALWTNPDCATDADGDGRVGDCHGWNFTTDSPDVDNGSYGTHGTSVAGVIAARAGNGEGSAGVAPGVQIMPLVIGSGESVDVYLGAEAIRYAADHGASVVNASWGGSFSGPALDALESAVAYAASKGVLVVAAAGNDSANRDSSIVYPASLTDPNLVTVGAATAADTVSDFSAYGAASVDLFAPGTLVFTTWNDGGYRLVSGTSIAAPQVAAALALYRAVDPTATTDQLRDRLLADVDPEPAFVGRSVTGGRLSLAHLGDSTEAVRYAFTSMTAPAGVVTPHVTATDPDAAAGSYSVQFGLGMEYAHEVMAFSGAVVTLGGTTATTDDDGLVTFDLGARSALDGLELSPSVDLGDGRYVLTAQVYLDGQPLGRAHAAPLLVGSSVVPGGGTTVGGSGASGSGTGDGTGDPAAGDPTSGDPTSGDPAAGGSGSGAPGSDPGAAGPGSAGSGGSAGDPGSGTAPGSSGGSTPGDPPSGGDQSGSVPEAPDSSVPEVTGGSTPAPAGGSSTDTGSGTSGSDSSDAGSGSAGSGDGGSPAPGTGPVPEEGGVVDYPAVGTFRITSLSPARVSTDGGTLVTVTGEALPSGARVLVGSTASATVVRASATELVFRAPARVVGTYSVAVFAPDGRSMVLDNALEYVDTTAGGSGSTPSDAGSGSGTDAGGAGGPGTDSGTGTGGSSAGGSGGSGSAGPGGGSGGSAELVVRRGPNGERLVRSAHFAGLSSIWSLDCSASCTGVAI